MAWVMAIPALVSAAKGIYDMSAGASKQNYYAENPYFTKPSPASEVPWGTATDSDLNPHYNAPGGSGPLGTKIADLQNMGKTGLASPTVGAARDQQNEMRNQYLAALAALQKRAAGEDSVVAAQAQVEREKAQKQFMSQLATLGGQGYYSPAAAAQAQGASSGYLSSIAGPIAAAAAQERMAAQNAYLQAIGAGRAQDLGLMGQELDQERARQQFYTAMEGAGQNWYGTAQQAGQFGDTLRFNYEKLLADENNAAAGRQMAAAQNQQQMGTNLMLGGLQGASGVLGLYNQMGQQQGGGGDSSSGSDLIDPWKKK